MKVIMVMFDSLNRHHLPPYGCDWTHAPNFQRLAQRAATFERSYVCSMPCMPARRDLHTGRPNFLHRSWGPIEPFDDSVPEMLKQNGIHTHLATDHQHYFEDGGATYHSRYTTWEFFRGQEGDPWIGQVASEPPAHNVHGRNAAEDRWHAQDRINRKFMTEEHQQPQAGTFRAGHDFIERNADQDNWFLQIETFDPHEPFFSQRKYKDLFAQHYDEYRQKLGKHWDWPDYAPVTEPPEMVEHMRYEYASLLAMCDAYLGEVLDAMDRHNMWEDTMLIVWTDHGFMLGEHDCWAKMWMGFYEEVSHTPFFMWDPRSPGCAGQRRQALVQPSIDLGPTLLEFFNIEPTADMTGKVLRDTVADDTPVRDLAIFGIFGGHINATDGRYFYMRGPASDDNQPLYEHTLMPTHMRHTFSPDELRDNIELAEPFTFTKGCRTMKIATQYRMGRGKVDLSTRLFDLETDPAQEQPIDDPQTAQRLDAMIAEVMAEAEAPPSQYERMGLSKPAAATR